MTADTLSKMGVDPQEALTNRACDDGTCKDGAEAGASCLRCLNQRRYDE